MRISIDHATVYRYDRPARAVIQLLRLTPHSHEGQQIISWRLESDVDARIRVAADAFGNIVHNLYTEEPVTVLTTRVVGEVVTQDTAGVVRGLRERHPPAVYLRQTALTTADPELAAFADAVVGRAGSQPLDQLHRLLDELYRHIDFDVDATHAATTAAEAFRLGRGVCQDLAHVFIAASRRMGYPARYVSGHLVRSDGAEDQQAAHAWAEAYVDGLGWVGFDPANGICPSDSYVRVAIGLDYLGAAPVRGAAYGGAGERLSVQVRVRESQTQHQG